VTADPLDPEARCLLAEVPRYLLWRFPLEGERRK
jgi:hypothetical protein